MYNPSTVKINVKVKVEFVLNLTKEYVAQQYLRIPSKYRKLVPLEPHQRVPVYFRRAGESQRQLTQAIIGPNGQRIFFRKASRESGLPNPFEALNVRVGDRIRIQIDVHGIMLEHVPQESFQ